MKKQVLVTLLAVLAISILPGCGKSKNNGPNVPGGGGVIIGPGPGPIVPGSATFTASGSLQMSNASGRVYGYLNANSATTGGTLYTRTNGVGDRVDLYINGSAPYGTGYTNVQATVVVQLAQATVDAFTYYCGSGPVRAEFNGNQLVSGSTGTIPESIVLRAANGCYGNI